MLYVYIYYLIINNYLRQNDFVSITKTVIISNLPKNIAKHNKAFIVEEKNAKLPSGPITSILPIPVFVIHATTVAKDVEKSTPQKLIHNVKKAKHSKKEITYTNTDIDTFSSILTSPTFKGTTLLGSTTDKKYFLKKAYTTCHLNILIEPDVDPVQPPTNARRKNTIVDQTPQSTKLQDDNPVVVITEITLKKAYIIA